MTRPLTVVQILPALNAGGVERGTLEIASALVAAGHRSIVISSGGRLVAELVAAGSEHHELAVHRKSLASLAVVPALRRLLKRLQPDIVHVRSRVPAWLVRFALINWYGRRRPQLVSTVHGLYSVNAYSAIMARADAVITVSDTATVYVEKHYPKVPRGQLQRIYRGIDPAAFPRGYQPSADWWQHSLQEFPALRDQQLLVLPGRLTPLKGHDRFLQLIAGLRASGFPVHGVVVGGIEPRKAGYLPQLQQQAATLGIADHLTFTGNRRDIRDWLAAARLVLSLSRQPESFGRTTLEALSLGVPVLAYDYGGVGEILKQLYPIGAVPLHDDAALLARAQQLLRQPVPVAPFTDFQLRDMCAQTLALYQQLAERNAV